MKDLRDDLELELMNAKINATSPYNDGWTQQGYNCLLYTSPSPRDS